MPIRKMIAAHPRAGGHVNEPLAQAVRQMLDCAITCTACADACAAGKMDMARCIRVCLDCADICGAGARVLVRQGADNADAIRALLHACIAACDACAAECDRHDQAHCRLCAATCRQCADDCREMLAGV